VLIPSYRRSSALARSTTLIRAHGGDPPCVRACTALPIARMASTFCFERFGRLLTYVRPFGAEHKSAGPDEVRRPGFPSKKRALRSVRLPGFPGLRWLPLSFITSLRTCQTRIASPREGALHSAGSRASGSSSLRKHIGAEAFAGLHHRKDDPGELVGKRHSHKPRGLAHQQGDDPVAQCALAFA
jgi:hypothetical protein